MTCRLFQIAIACLWSVVAASALGQIPENLPGEPEESGGSSSIGRIIRHFDFEERGFNALDIPLYWIRAQHDPEVRDRPGFPITNLGRLDYQAPTTSGFGAVRLDTTGGSTSLRLEPGVATTFPSVRYAVGAMVRVEGLKHARPRLAARLLDEEGRPIAGTSASALVEPSVDGWDQVFVPVLIKLPAAPAEAVSLQIDLELVQPQEFASRSDGSYALWSEDYAGSAWFDDVVIVQLPTASLATTRPSNTFLAGEAPELLVDVRDLSGDPIELELRVRDIDGVVVAERSEQFEAGAREIRWRPDLQRLGWYEAELLLRVGSIPMLRLRERFVWLPDATGAHLAMPNSDGIAPDRVALMALSDRRRLAMVTPPHGDEPLTSAAREVFERSGSRTLLVTVPVSSPAGAESAEWTQLARTFTSLRSQLGAQNTVILDVISEADVEASERSSEGDRALAAFDDGALWDEVLVPLIDRLAEGVNRWHVGPLGSDALAATPSSAGTLKRIGERLHRLAPDPTMGAPWWGGFDPAAAMLPDGQSQRRSGGTIEWSLTMRVPQQATGAWIEEAARKIGTLLESGGASEGVLVLEPLDETLFGRHAAVAHLAEQMLAFWAALSQPALPQLGVPPSSELRLALADAYRWQDRGEHEVPLETGTQYYPVDATAQLAAWRAIGDRLIGRRLVHDFTTANGVDASVYHAVVPRATGSGGLLVLHPPSARGRHGHAPSFFEFYLGEEPVRVFDVFGNERIVEATEAHDAASEVPRMVHRIELSDWPVFVEGVDVDLLLFIASLRLEPARLPAIDTEHQAALVMRNPWPGVTSVRVRVVSPGGFGGQPVTQRSWEISPRLTELLLEGGVERRTPINIRFRRSEPAGRKNLGLELDIRGEQAARRVRVDVPFDIGLEYLSVVASARRTPEGLMVQAEVRNLGDRPITLEATAIAQGARRERAIIARLPAGATARRDILVRGVGDVDRVLLAVEDADVGGRLNYEVDVP